MGRFLITGLPRSRTAWFAVAASSGGRTCWHEPSATLGLSSLMTIWEAMPDMGVSDAGLAPHLTEVLDVLGPKTLVIHRDPDEVVTSMRDYVSPRERVSAEWIANVRKIARDTHEKLLSIEHPLIKRINYCDLGNGFQHVLEDCFDWLGVKPNGLTQLMHMNVQSDLAFNLGLLARLAA